MRAVHKLKAAPVVRVPKQARSRRTREQILKAAVACFEARGYEETTTPQIARRARIAVGTFYTYFRDKRAVLLELLDGTVNEIANYVVQNLDSARWEDADLRAGVRNLIDALFHTHTFNPGMQRIVWERYFKDPEFRRAVEAIERRVRTAMIDLFVSLKARRKLRITDFHTAAFVIHSSIEWIASRLMLGSADADTDAAVAVASDMVSRFLFRD
ncbi:MAG TPA: TetR/AcrR family transcriptional regulator [Candidatus Binatia bacterium]|nr:TetR/AcrR family transcriptional regulator [Candidatus Binatia bacterium]